MPRCFLRGDVNRQAHHTQPGRDPAQPPAPALRKRRLLGRRMASVQTGTMTPPERESYSAKFIDGPLEGKTMRIDFLESGDPQPRLEVAADSDDQSTKRFVYTRGSGLEYEEGQPGGRPSAVDYRYVEVLVE